LQDYYTITSDHFLRLTAYTPSTMATELSACLGCLELGRGCCECADACCHGNEKSNKCSPKMVALILVIIGVGCGVGIMLDKHGQCGEGDNNSVCETMPTVPGLAPQFHVGGNTDLDVNCKFPTECSIASSDGTVHSVLHQTSDPFFSTHVDFGVVFPAQPSITATCRRYTFPTSVKCQLEHDGFNTTSYELGSQWSRVVTKDSTTIGKVTPVTLGCHVMGLLANQPCDRMCIATSTEIDPLLVYNMEIMLKLPRTFRGGHLNKTVVEINNSTTPMEPPHLSGPKIAVA